MTNIYPKQLVWDDLPDCVAIVSPLNESTTQVGLHYQGRQVAHILALDDAILALTELMLPDDTEPDTAVLIAIGRVLVAHRRASKEGRKLS